MSIFYTSDTHFSHKNIMKHENRPFYSVEEMDYHLIEQWNKSVTNNDTVYHLGDFAFGGKSKWETILTRLNGRIHLVLGNHDNQKIVKKIAHHFVSVENMIVKKIDNQYLYLFHYPIEIGLTPNAYSIHGHIHGRHSNHVNQINVGVDSSFTVDKIGFGNPIPEEIIIDELKHRFEMVMDLRKQRRGEE